MQINDNFDPKGTDNITGKGKGAIGTMPMTTIANNFNSFFMNPC